MTKQKLGYWQQTYVDHLRSGYRKLQNSLCNVDEKGNCSYCAFGLMCEIAHQNGLCDAQRCNEQWIYSGCYYTIPGPVLELFRVCLHRSIQYNDRKYVSLAELNDMSEITFDELADMIEADPSMFFEEPA